MFNKLASMVRQAWTEAGEQKLVTVFFASYIDCDDFNKWHVGVTGLPGCTGSNQATERSQLEAKGCKHFDGLMKCGKLVQEMLSSQFPSFIQKLSLERVGVVRKSPLDCPHVVLQGQSKVWKELLEFNEKCNDTIDVMDLSQIQPGNDTGFLVNTEEHLGRPVTRQRWEAHQQALNGESDLPHSKRREFYECVESLCRVTCARTDDGAVKWSGSCWAFMERGYCCHAAKFAYQNELLDHGQPVPHNRAGKMQTRTSTYNRTHKKTLNDLCVSLGKAIIDLRKRVDQKAKRASKADGALISKCRKQIDFTNNVLAFTDKISDLQRTQLEAHLEQAAKAERAASECTQFLNRKGGSRKQEKFWHELYRLLFGFRQQCNLLK